MLALRRCGKIPTSTLLAVCEVSATPRIFVVHLSFAPRTTQPNKPASSYFYDYKAVDEAATRPSVRLTPSSMLYSGKAPDGRHLVRSARYLHRELPVRIAHRIDDFRQLPFIVGCNAYIIGVHDLYLRAFEILTEFPSIQTVECSQNYARLLRSLLEDHREVVTQLAKGFRESDRLIHKKEIVQSFLDKTLTSRLGIRMLAMHHLALHNEQPDHVGIINKAMRLQSVVSRWCDFVTGICQDRYGRCPAFRLSGHVDAAIPYIQVPLDYILPELLKNAARATVESHPEAETSDELPTVYITVASNDYDFVIRISDRGGGVPHNLRDKIFEYNFTTATTLSNTEGYGMQAVQGSSTNRGPMHGFGFGLPTSKAYAEYLGGSLEIQSMGGTGTDVYLTLPHIQNSTAEDSPFRI